MPAQAALKSGALAYRVEVMAALNVACRLYVFAVPDSSVLVTSTFYPSASHTNC